MKCATLTLFPELFEPWLRSGLIGQAHARRAFEYETLNPRQFSAGVHQSVDDKVYGGGDGMVQSFLPWSRAIETAKVKNPEIKIVFLTPQGELWNQARAREWLGSEKPSFLFVCGRYGGFDQRLLHAYADKEISVGDYVLNGGELAAMVVMESLMRGLPETLGNENSFSQDSFGEDGLLECPSFTRPQELPNGLKVPEFLLSGNHLEIERSKRAVALLRTKKRRPDLFLNLVAKHKISARELAEATDLVEKMSETDRKILGV